LAHNSREDFWASDRLLTRGEFCSKKNSKSLEVEWAMRDDRETSTLAAP
jgi:hypothetical protein